MAPAYTVIHGCPVPTALAPLLDALLRETGATLNSCYRGDEAASLLHRLGKHTQRELFEGFQKHLPGYYPANPPGFSTHELRNDGLAYPMPRGAKLAYWQVGIDVNDSDVKRLIAAAARKGWKVAQTYPNSSAEYHHVNFRKPPLRHLIAAKLGLVKKPQHLSPKGAQFIGRFEGFIGTPYNDPVGYATIGFGHLLHKSNVTEADRTKWGTLSKARGYALLQQDAEVAAAAVRQHVTAKLNQAQFDALVSFAFNVGVGAFEGSTLLKVINARKGGPRGITDKATLRRVRAEFLRWDKAGGREVPGLKTRRVAEGLLFAAGRYS